jgi:hypothetical protein
LSRLADRIAWEYRKQLSRQELASRARCSATYRAALCPGRSRLEHTNGWPVHEAVRFVAQCPGDLHEDSTRGVPQENGVPQESAVLALLVGNGYRAARDGRVNTGARAETVVSAWAHGLTNYFATAAFRASTRSVRSQVKSSPVRPKWPFAAVWA